MKQKKKLIQFGAGNIGRSFIGQVFSQAGYEIVFVCRKHGVPCPNIFKAVAAGFFFKAGDENGRMFPPDEDFFRKLAADGIHKVLEEICGLNAGDPQERGIIEVLEGCYLEL